MRSAQAEGLYLVSLNWLIESIDTGKILAEKDFIFDTAVAPAPVSKPDGASTSQTTIAPRTGIRTSKRTASNLKDMNVDKDDEQEKPATKKPKTTVKGGAADGEPEAEVKPRAKRSATSQKDKERTEEEEMDIDDDEQAEKSTSKKPKAAAKGKKNEKLTDEEKPVPVKPKTTARGKGKGKGKAKQEITPEPEEDEEEAEEEQKPKMKTVIKKGKAPVDELCPGSSKLSAT